MYEAPYRDGAAQCPARLSARRNAVTIQLAVAAELGRGTRSRGGQGMIGCRERRAFGEEPSRQGLETQISFSPSIVDCAVQPMRHSSLSSKIQATAADVVDRNWTSPSGTGENKFKQDADAQKTLSSHTAGSCAWARNLMW